MDVDFDTSMKFDMGEHRDAPEISAQGEGPLTISTLASTPLSSRLEHLLCLLSPLLLPLP